MNQNKITYSSKAVISYYTQSEGLQLPESNIFGLIEENIRGKRMLDIGVGGGRTTPYFKNIVSEYIGIDYSPEMIEYCRRKFSPDFPHAKFEVRDARNLTSFRDHCFDFILFSFNGIDYLNYEERTQVLNELRRICDFGGFLCFSSHNIQCVRDVFRFKFRLNPFLFFTELFNHPRLLALNRNQLSLVDCADHVILNDGAHDFGLLTCYVRPEVQINSLKKTGFNSIRVFGLEKGHEVQVGEISENRDPWLYYLCG